MRFIKKQTREQVKQGLALFALAKPMADDARKARQAHAIEAGEAITCPDMATEAQVETSTGERPGGSKGRIGRGDKEPRQSRDFPNAISTTDGPRHV